MTLPPSTQSNRQLTIRIEKLELQLQKVWQELGDPWGYNKVDTMLCHTKGKDEQDQEVYSGVDGKSSVFMSSAGDSLPLPSIEDVQRWSERSGNDPTREEKEGA